MIHGNTYNLSELHRSFTAFHALLARFPLSIIQFAMRIAVGMVFFKSGLLKIRSWEFAIRLFQDEYQVPLLDPVLAARTAVFTELSVPVLLFAGLATRFATLPLLGMIAVIQLFVYPQAWAEHLLWTSVLLFLLLRGPGKLSLDHLIWRYAGQRSVNLRVETSRIVRAD